MYAQQELSNKKPQSKLVNHVTTDVLSVKTEQTQIVKHVPRITTYMEHLVSHVPYVTQLMECIVTPRQTTVHLVSHNVYLVPVPPTLVMNVSNQELTHQFVIVQPDNSMMA
jgi:hypothetical protein